MVGLYSKARITLKERFCFMKHNIKYYNYQAYLIMFGCQLTNDQNELSTNSVHSCKSNDSDCEVHNLIIFPFIYTKLLC